MFDTIFVPVDNSDYSRVAVDTAIRLGQAFDSRLVGCHVYAAQLHDYRFKQMEFTLPEQYLEEDELEHQREVHDSLITRGLEMISDSYLDAMSRACAAAGLELERKTMDGKHHVELAADISQCGYDLVVMGAFGLGKARDSSIGSVTERVSRSCSHDFWVVRDLQEDGGGERDTILVALDGSPQSFGGLLTAAELARAFGKKLELLAVYDPYLHYSVFSRIAGVLSEEAAEVFRFEEQNQLHEDIIDSGLAKIYRSHLEV
jgi:nucleotide-binding universal stress UspA family protein